MSTSVGVGADDISSQGPPPTGTTLTVALTDSADPVITGVAFSYALVVTNTGSLDATTVVASVTLDASLTYGSASGTGWTVDASALPVVTFTRATLAVGAAPTITINVTSGGAAVAASSTGNASASNAASATPSVQATTVKLVSNDATSGIRVPASAQEWTDFIAYAGLSNAAPNSLWLCQEASGNLADSIGSLTLAAASSPTYSNAATGWTRVGVGTVDGGTAKFMAGIGIGPNPTLTSTLWIFVVAVAATAAGNRMIMTSGGSTAALDNSVFITGATGVPFDRCAGVSVNGTVDVRNTIQPIAILYDRTGSRSMTYTASQKIAGTYSATVTDGNKGIGSAFSAASSSSYLYGIMFSGAAAELTDAQIKSLLLALGWAIPWS